MQTPVERVQNWRDQKRREGYVPMTVWLQPPMKHKIEDLAAKRREDLGQVITAAVLAFEAAGPVGDASARTVRQLVAESLATLAPQLLQMPPQHAPLPAAPEPVPSSPVLLPGERGAQIQAVRALAPQLRRFTCATMANHIKTKPKNLLKTLYQMTKKGELIKKGSVYFWVDPTTPD